MGGLMICRVALVRCFLSCLVVPALLVGCGSEPPSAMLEGDIDAEPLASLAQPIIEIGQASELSACGSESLNQVYYVLSEDQLYYCDGDRLRELNLTGDPSWLTDTIAAPPSLCSSGGVVVRSGPDRNRDGSLDATEISASSPVCNGNDGATGATGPQGPAGEGALQGPSGPLSPWGGSAEAPGPVPYDGDFVLDIDGFIGTVELSAFGGCFDQYVGVFYQDCFFEVEGLPSPVVSWLSETLSGDSARHDLTVRQIDPSGAAASDRVVAQLRISAGWISDFRLSDFDVAATGTGKLTFVVVPESLTSESPTEAGTSPSVESFSPGDFTLAIPDVGPTGIAALSGLYVHRDKLGGAGPDPERAYFSPGDIYFDDLTLVAAQTGGALTLQDLTRWVDGLDNSTSDRRDGLLTITSGPNAIAEIHLPGLMPLTGLSLVGERRSLTLQVQSFDLALTP